MSGEEVAQACKELETAVYVCLARSQRVKQHDLQPLLNLLSGRLRATSDQLGEAASNYSLGYEPDLNELEQRLTDEVNYG